MKRTLNLIKVCAQVPSFSSYEDRLHPLIEKAASGISHVSVHKVPDNNLIIQVRGNPTYKPIALTAHLDKINHFGGQYPAELPVRTTASELIGQLDDAVGVGILLSVLELHSEQNDPPLLLLFSEMEEGHGLRNHPHLLRNNGEGLYPRIGADRISQYLISQGIIPGLIVTIDTTPLFGEARGVALYSQHWELNNLTPRKALIKHTGNVCEMVQRLEPTVTMHNNINDYIHYGFNFNRYGKSGIVPCIAIEPAIYPYHQNGERVYTGDIEKTHRLLVALITEVRDQLDWLRSDYSDTTRKNQHRGASSQWTAI